MARGSDDAITLTISSGWKEHQARHRRSLFCYSLLLPTAVVLTLVAAILHSPFVIVAGVLSVAFAAGLYYFDMQWTRALRFSRASGSSVVARPQGVEASAYPLTWYRPSQSATVGGYVVPPTSQILKSRIFGRAAEVVDRPNFVSWPKTTVVVGDLGGALVVGFWSKNILVESSILAGLVCGVPGGKFPNFVVMATEGGADFHSNREVLTASGLAAAIPCPRHDAGRNRIPRDPPRLRRPESAAEAAEWFRASSS